MKGGKREKKAGDRLKSKPKKYITKRAGERFKGKQRN